jgi:hypothetical protein
MILIIQFLSMQMIERLLVVILVYNIMVRKLTYEEKDLKGEMVNIYQKPQALINYLIDKFSNEGD